MCLAILANAAANANRSHKANTVRGLLKKGRWKNWRNCVMSFVGLIMLWRSHEIIIETTELSVEGQEVVKGERFIGIKDEVQRHIMIHGGYKAVGTGRP